MNTYDRIRIIYYEERIGTLLRRIRTLRMLYERFNKAIDAQQAGK